MDEVLELAPESDELLFWAGLATGATASLWVAETIWALIGLSAALALAIRASRFLVASCVFSCR